MPKISRTWVEVSRHALEHNVAAIRNIIRPETKLMAVVKSNAYGHGLVECGRIFSRAGLPSRQAGADWLGVFSLDEAIELRKKNIRAPILILGHTEPERFKEALKYKTSITVVDRDALRFIPKKLPIHIKIETGLSRQGVQADRFDEFFAAIPAGTHVEGIFSHLADPLDVNGRRYSQFQKKNFDHAIEIARHYGFENLMKHLNASDGMLSFPQGEYDMIRAGILLYGVWPSFEFQSHFRSIDLIPALTWKTRVIQVKKIPKDSYVGYGLTERVDRDTLIAVLPVGYYDGYPRSLSSKGIVLINGVRCQVLGRVSMNMIVTDITDAGVVHTGNEAVLIGRQGNVMVGAEELADRANAISYEVITRINPLLPRTVIE